MVCVSLCIWMSLVCVSISTHVEVRGQPPVFVLTFHLIWGRSLWFCYRVGQASWPGSFKELSCLYLLSPCRSTLGFQMPALHSQLSRWFRGFRLGSCFLHHKNHLPAQHLHFLFFFSIWGWPLCFSCLSLSQSTRPELSSFIFVDEWTSIGPDLMWASDKGYTIVWFLMMF